MKRELFQVPVNRQDEERQDKTYLSYVDIVGADLSWLKLAGKEFRGSDLRQVSFVGTWLQECSFAGANLSGADLHCSCLRKASFMKANLQGANLRATDLRDVDFYLADMRGADLTNADLRGADLGCADLTGANLKGAIGLGTKQGEMEFAANLVAQLDAEQDSRIKQEWRNNPSYVMCVYPKEFDYNPGRERSLLYPTLAKFFHGRGDEALIALRKIATGELSVFND